MTDHLPKRTRGDLALDAASVLASAVPYAGGPISAILSGVANDRKFRRLQDVIEGMAEDLQGLESSVTEQYVRTEDFTDLLEQTLRRVADEGSAEKRLAYRNLLVNLMRDPIQDVEVPRRVVRLLDELGAGHLRVLCALIQSPGQEDVAASPLGTLLGRLPGTELGELQELVNDLNDARLTRINNFAILTGRGSADLTGYLTTLGGHVAHLASRHGPRFHTADPPPARHANSKAGGGRELHDRWSAIRGTVVRLEPLHGLAGTEPDPWFQVADVSDADVRFEKQSTLQHVRMPLFALSLPWGAEEQGGARAVIQVGKLRFHADSERWQWELLA